MGLPCRRVMDSALSTLLGMGTMNPVLRNLRLGRLCGGTGFLAYFITYQLLALRPQKPLEPPPEPQDTTQEAKFTFSPSTLEEPNDYRADLQAGVELVREHWSYLAYREEHSDLDLSALSESAFAILGEEPTENSFVKALTSLIASLQDGHGGVFLKKYVRPTEYRWPFSLIEVQEGLMIDGFSLADGLDPKLLGIEATHRSVHHSLQRGDLLLSIEEEPIEAFIEEAARFVFASTDGARRRKAITRMARYDEDSRRTFHFQRPGHGSFELELSLYPSYVTLKNTPNPLTKRDSRLLTKDIGYFRPGDFSPPKHERWRTHPELRDEILADSYSAIEEDLRQLASARGWILDLRGNPGGTDLLGQFLVDHFLDSDFVYFQLSSKKGRDWLPFGSHGSNAPKTKSSLLGPLVCLVDEFTFSTADNVSFCLDDMHPDVQFVGRPNGAGTGAPRTFDLPRTNARITFCTMRVKTPNGRISEGVPVPLDIPVTWTRLDHLEGKEPDLEAAIATLERRLPAADAR